MASSMTIFRNFLIPTTQSPARRKKIHFSETTYLTGQNFPLCEPLVSTEILNGWNPNIHNGIGPIQGFLNISLIN